MAQRSEGWRAPGSRVGRPHGKDKKAERQEQTRMRCEANGIKHVVSDIDVARKRRAPQPS